MDGVSMSLEADWFLRAHPEITTIEALLPDCNGVMRGKWLPRHKLGKIFDGELKLPKTALIPYGSREFFCDINFWAYIYAVPPGALLTWP